MTELTSLTASKLGPLIKEKQVSPVELMEETFERINKLDSTLNAYITLLPDYALEKAQQAEKDIMRGLYKGPLHGIPIGIKDNYYTKGITTTVGSKIFQDYIPDSTATAVEKLLCAGGIMTGKLNMHEFGGGLTNTNHTYGNARNPWNVNYMPGGSSGGSGAALAAGLATLATGTDTFGSIRVPASMCGLYGLKPTYGLVSTEGVAPLSWSMDHAGPMARSIDDLALMLQYMAGYDPEDPGSIKAPIPDYKKGYGRGIKGLKIGVPTYFMEGLDADVEEMFNKAIATLQQMGAEILYLTIPSLTMSSYAAYLIVPAEASAYHYENLQQKPRQFETDVRVFFETGVVMSGAQYVRSQQIRRKMTEALKAAFEKVDLLIGPTIPIAPQPFHPNWVQQNLEIIERCMPFTSPANLTGIPSLNVPMGLSEDGLPLGMQLMGNHLTENLLLQVGREWEKTDPLIEK
ncbi:glutamyl-tRNA amidotransferase [Alkalihalophilus pseudofirmus]|uniref:amidase n=1 Tax=Alkalihalophilus pseudofirmus TaxID=79885 RepID=UPI0009527A8D|nr:glutamyl-tRNA amidotransferase [Alkalihalophilus pseudofirmus]